MHSILLRQVVEHSGERDGRWLHRGAQDHRRECGGRGWRFTLWSSMRRASTDPREGIESRAGGVARRGNAYVEAAWTGGLASTCIVDEYCRTLSTNLARVPSQETRALPQIGESSVLGDESSGGKSARVTSWRTITLARIGESGDMENDHSGANWRECRHERRVLCR